MGVRPLTFESFFGALKISFPPRSVPGCVQYWVSQGNKWCDFCKIYIANNSVSIRTHELGLRHKDNVAQRLSTMRKESAAKEKEHKEAAKALEQIEEKAKRCYQKDMASFQQAHKSTNNSAARLDNAPDKSVFSATSGEWEHDAASGYYYNLANGYHYDPNTSLFYSSSIGIFVCIESAYKGEQQQSNNIEQFHKSNHLTFIHSTSTIKSGRLHMGNLPTFIQLEHTKQVRGACIKRLTTKTTKDISGRMIVRISSTYTKMITLEETDLKEEEVAIDRHRPRGSSLLGLRQSHSH
ncbi:hypothetical protein KSP40_PGU012663 [Platanthera guangdongensis]|uniref:Matrin-type domain-containing protein n=1 Tax=Platanthera guangdongensis TaxID=2320717 RepID=A0ABR2N5K4_9ASPA